MNDKDIELFASLMSDGIASFDTEQISREPIELKKIDSSAPIVFNEGRRGNDGRLHIDEVKFELRQFAKTVEQIRESDKTFSKAYKAEEKRQAQIVKKLNKALKK